MALPVSGIKHAGPQSATMKFKGFNNQLLNLGDLDLQLAIEPSSHPLLSCAGCKFTTSEMLYCSCGHVYCNSCLLQFNGAADADPVIKGHCTLCHRSVSAMKIAVQEAFVADLQFRCPQCHQVFKLQQMKPHVEPCMFSQIGEGDNRTVKATSSISLNMSLRLVDETSSTIQRREEPSSSQQAVVETSSRVADAPIHIMCSYPGRSDAASGNNGGRDRPPPPYDGDPVERNSDQANRQPVWPARVVCGPGVNP